TSGYEEVSTLQLLDGIVDIYLTDIRYTDDALGEKYSLVPDYWTVTKKAVKEMFRQTGSFREERMRGVIVRHLVLPEGIAGTEEMAEFVAFELSSSVSISLMSQYRPVYRAREHYELSRKISEEEYDYALVVIDRFGLTGWMQHFESKENFRAKPLRWD
ncbi:MAG TPA: radical SAM protein, partial [Mesotoga sp.]|nr:radical SAM protein [Mesotoga sp.]